MKVIIAVDPGKSGGYAVNWGHGSGARRGIEVYKMPESEVELIDQIKSVKSYADDEGYEIEAVIETVGGYVGGKGAPGSSMFNRFRPRRSHCARNTSPRDPPAGMAETGQRWNKQDPRHKAEVETPPRQLGQETLPAGTRNQPSDGGRTPNP